MSNTPLAVPIPDITQLAQNAARLLQQSLAQAEQAAGAAGAVAMTATDLELARGNIKALAFVQAVGLHGAYRYLRDFIARQAIPIKAREEFLDGWLQTYGLRRKDAAVATGTAAGTGVNGTVLPAGTVLQAGDGRQYRVYADVVVAAGVVRAGVVALLAGAAANAPAGAALSLVSATVGVDSAFTVLADAISGGADVESDAQAVYRLSQRLANEPMGGSPADYARWALAVPGITRAWGVRNPAGATTAGVIIMADGNAPPGLPTGTQRQRVIDYICDPRRGPPDELFVIVPKAKAVDVTVRLAPDSAATRVGVYAALQDLFFREAAPGGSLPMNHLIEAISGVNGEFNHTLMTPGVYSGGLFSTRSFDELLVLGVVSFV